MRVTGKSVARAEPQIRAPEAEVVEPGCREKPLSDEAAATVPQTDTGRRVENTQANGRTFVKELGKLAP
jgi:hypothetical protein